MNEPEAHRVHFSWGTVVLVTLPLEAGDRWQQLVTAADGGLELRFGGADDPYLPVTQGALRDDPFRLVNLLRHGQNLLLILDPPVRWTGDAVAVRWRLGGVSGEITVRP